MKAKLPLLLAFAVVIGFISTLGIASAHDHQHGAGAAPAATGMPAGTDMMADKAAMHEAMESKMADTSAFGRKGDTTKAKRTVNVTMTDNAFDLRSLRVKKGQTVHFVITNKGTLPHEFTIEDAKYGVMARKMMKQMADIGEDTASPEHAAMHGAAGNSATLKAGETKDIVWTFSKPGKFEYACNVPGHSEGGMKGTILVK